MTIDECLDGIVARQSSGEDSCVGSISHIRDVAEVSVATTGAAQLECNRETARVFILILGVFHLQFNCCRRSRRDSGLGHSHSRLGKAVRFPRNRNRRGGNDLQAIDSCRYGIVTVESSSKCGGISAVMVVLDLAESSTPT